MPYLSTPCRSLTSYPIHSQFQLVALKLLTEQMLLGRPRQGAPGVLPSINLFIPGELQRQKLVLSRRPVVYASPNNPGALAVAKDIASATHGQIEVTSDAAEVVVEGRSVVTHFLLYLNDQTYLHEEGEKLAEELRRARATGSTIKVVMVHENDAERGGCEFGILFDGRTPQDLLHDGIYNVRLLTCSIYLLAYCPPLPLLGPLCMHHQPRPPVSNRRLRSRSTPGGSGRSRSR